MPQVYNTDDRETVIRKLAGNIAKHNPDSFRILTGQDRLTVPEQITGDIQLLAIASNDIILSILVETADTISLERAGEFWLPVANRGPVEIAVPKKSAQKARNIIKKLNVKIRLMEY